MHGFPSHKTAPVPYPGTLNTTLGVVRNVSPLLSVGLETPDADSEMRSEPRAQEATRQQGSIHATRGRAGRGLLTLSQPLLLSLPSFLPWLSPCDGGDDDGGKQRGGVFARIRCWAGRPGVSPLCTVVRPLIGTTGLCPEHSRPLIPPMRKSCGGRGLATRANFVAADIVCGMLSG